MKLASEKSGRDGRLVVVSRDLSRAADASGVAPTLQAALDDWDRLSPWLIELFERLESDKIPSVPFEQATCAPPLPRAYQWVDGSAYVNHVELVRKARGAEMPASFWTDPLMYQGNSDSFLAPHSPIQLADESWGIDFEAEIAVITNDVAMGVTPQKAKQSVLLFCLVNDVSLRNLIPQEIGKGLGFVHSKPSSALSPVMVTPDELGDAWDGKTVDLQMLSHLNDRPFGRPNTRTDMTFDFPTLIAHAARTRTLIAGTIVGSGTISNRGADGGCGKPIEQGGDGYSCIAEIRMVETIMGGKPVTPFMSFGDRIRIEMRDRAGGSIFGAIDQQVERYAPA